MPSSVWLWRCASRMAFVCSGDSSMLVMMNRLLVSASISGCVVVLNTAHGPSTTLRMVVNRPVIGSLMVASFTSFLALMRLRMADKLQENNLAAVRILPKRFAELERNQPYVAFIGITPIAKG